MKIQKKLKKMKINLKILIINLLIKKKKLLNRIQILLKKKKKIKKNYKI